MDCPEANALAEYADGLLSEPATFAIQRHIDRCEACRGVLGALAGADTLHAPARDASSGAPAALGDSHVLAPGTTLDRHVILSVVGAGGMGVVYQAYDPALDRRVALKVLRRAPGTPRDNDQLQREARLLAKLSHPNVLAIHEVGTIEDHAYLVLEFVPGQTLAAPRETALPWRRALGWLIAAGRGLAAAHRAGVIHRDVKPSNVLIGIDDRVRVLDFGLARIGSSGPTADPGDLSGTPRYMAPELLGEGPARAPANERSDQWSFAATALEVLARSRPPARVLRVLRRAHATEPAQRFASMASLVAALERAARPRRWPAFAALAALLGVAGLVWSTRDDGYARCVASGDDLFDPPSEAVLRARFASVGGAAGIAAADATAALLDRYRDGWTALHRETCEATRDATLSPALLDRRRVCLERRRREAATLVDWLSAARDRDVVVRGPDAVLGLSPVGDCAASDDELPATLAERLATDAVMRQLDQATPLRKTARVREAVRLLRLAVEAADRTGHAPTRAEARLRLAQAQLSASDYTSVLDSTREGLEAATHAGKDRRDAALWLLRMGALLKLARYDELLGLELPATVAIERVGGETARLRARLGEHVGNAWLQKRDVPKARARLEQALALLEPLGGADDPELAVATMSVRENLAILLQLESQADAAVAQFERSVQLSERTLGAAHPAVAATLSRLAAAELQSSDPARIASALAHLRRALAIQEAALGEVQATAYTLTILGGLLRGLGNLDEAWSMLERARAIYESTGGNVTALAALAQREAMLRRAQGRHGEEVALMRRYVQLEEKAVGPTAASMSDAWRDLAVSLLARGGADREAHEAVTRAVEILHGSLGDDHLATASARVDLGSIAARRGQFAVAEQLCAQSLARYRKAGAEPPPAGTTEEALVCLGEAALGRGRLARAEALARQALATTNSLGAHFLLARTLSRRGQLDRALGEARAAAAVPVDVAHADARIRRELTAWLAVHRRIE